MTVGKMRGIWEDDYAVLIFGCAKNYLSRHSSINEGRAVNISISSEWRKTFYFSFAKDLINFSFLLKDPAVILGG